MVFWIGIFVAAAGAWLAVKIGFRDTWLFMFNTVMAAFLAVFLTAPIIESVPSAGATAYGTAMTLVAAAVGAFVLLQGTAYAFVTSRYQVAFPKVLDTVGAGCMGFAAGFLIWSFLSITVSLTPIVGEQAAEQSGFAMQTQQAAIPYMGFFCDVPAKLVMTGGERPTTKEAIAALFETARTGISPTDPNSDRRSFCLEGPQTTVDHRKGLGAERSGNLSLYPSHNHCYGPLFGGSRFLYLSLFYHFVSGGRLLRRRL